MTRQHRIRFTLCTIAGSAALAMGLMAAPAELSASPEGFYGTPQTILKFCYRHQLIFWQDRRLETFGCRNERKLVLLCEEKMCKKPPPKHPPTLLFLKMGDEGGKGGDEGGGGRGMGGGSPNSPNGPIN